MVGEVKVKIWEWTQSREVDFLARYVMEVELIVHVVASESVIRPFPLCRTTVITQ